MAYTEQELIEHAKPFKTRAEWRSVGEQERLQGNFSHYGAALKRGREFMRQCCGHMLSGMTGNINGLKYTDEALIESAAPHKYKSDWRKADQYAYKMAARRPEVFARATAHMTPKANPYGGDYVIYAYEFADQHVYVGLTFLPKSRHATHMCRGPVFEHQKICPTFMYKIIEESVADPVSAQAAEKRWIEHYASSGWTMINSTEAGGLGSVAHNKWTKESVLAKAREFQTRKAWYLGSQFTYGLAKREGWFEEAVAHMPRRVLGVGAGRAVSAETREKQRQAKLGVRQSAAHRRARSAAVKEWWVRQNATPLGPP